MRKKVVSIPKKIGQTSPIAKYNKVKAHINSPAKFVFPPFFVYLCQKNKQGCFRQKTKGQWITSKV
jgi:hypothetical protein